MSQSKPQENMAQTLALDALGNSVRREIVEILLLHPRTAGELAQQLPISRPAVSKHLKLLKNAGLVIYQPKGTQNIYHLDTSGFENAHEWLDRFWSEALGRFRMVAENLHTKAKHEQ